MEGNGTRETYHVIDHGDEQIKEQLSARLHLVLHRAAPLERVPGADDQGEVVCS